MSSDMSGHLLAKRFLVGSILLVAAFTWQQTTHNAWAKDEKLPLNEMRLLEDPTLFPIGVWLQQPKYARQYKELGINMYVGLWKGPTTGQLAQLKDAGMPAITSQNDVGLTDQNRDVIIGWLQEDEPDNAQKRKNGPGYSPPVPPAEIIARYEEMRQKDPTRPVLLGLGQGVAWDLWQGRGVRTNHPEDYREYAKGGDIVSFDIYPVTHSHPLVAGRLEFIAKGVRRLVKWTDKKKPVWYTVGASRIGNLKVKPTPAQIRSQVWLSIISGARGLIYFVHQFKPVFKAESILDDPPLRDAMRSINRQIKKLATVISSPQTNDLIVLKTDGGKDQVVAATRQDGCFIYVFSTSIRAKKVITNFFLRQAVSDQQVEVLDENRTLKLVSGQFKDGFTTYGTHLYKIAKPKGCGTVSQ